ncbi:MAG: alpha/beta hydrolase [Chlamydiales bacterium]|nr:alpha/beta hydrolase [Chlamydiales bacterium]
MLKTLFRTQSRARLQLIYSSEEGDLNWLFLPGGPGLGSESLLPLLKILQLPGRLWLLDLPGDGSNTTSNNSESFKSWPVALVEATQSFDHVVLVAHSTGGMYALSLPELEKYLEGLVILDSAPDATWQILFAEIIKKQPVPGLQVLQENYEKDPSNKTLKALTLASVPYLFTKKGQTSGIESLRSLPYNYETCQWSDKHFDSTYQAKWVPQKIPALIMAGEEDLVTPLQLFEKEKRFCRDNITFQSIKNAGHFPWIENPSAVAKEFTAYAQQLKKI